MALHIYKGYSSNSIMVAIPIVYMFHKRELIMADNHYISEKLAT